jgi:hypothetical protein
LHFVQFFYADCKLNRTLKFWAVYAGGLVYLISIMRLSLFWRYH